MILMSNNLWLKVLHVFGLIFLIGVKLCAINVQNVQNEHEISNNDFKNTVKIKLDSGLPNGGYIFDIDSLVVGDNGNIFLYATTYNDNRIFDEIKAGKKQAEELGKYLERHLFEFDDKGKILLSKKISLNAFTVGIDEKIYVLLNKDDAVGELIVYDKNMDEIERKTITQDADYSLNSSSLFYTEKCILGDNGGVLYDFKNIRDLSEKDNLLISTLDKTISWRLNAKRVTKYGHEKEYFLEIKGLKGKFENCNSVLHFDSDGDVPWEVKLLNVDSNGNTYYIVNKNAVTNHHPLRSVNIYVTDPKWKFINKYSFAEDDVNSTDHHFRIFYADKNGVLYCVEKSVEGVFLTKWSI